MIISLRDLCVMLSVGSCRWSQHYMYQRWTGAHGKTRRIALLRLLTSWDINVFACCDRTLRFTGRSKRRRLSEHIKSYDGFSNVRKRVSISNKRIKLTLNSRSEKKPIPCKGRLRFRKEVGVRKRGARGEKLWGRWKT